MSESTTEEVKAEANAIVSPIVSGIALEEVPLPLHEERETREYETRAVETSVAFPESLTLGSLELRSGAVIPSLQQLNKAIELCNAEHEAGHKVLTRNSLLRVYACFTEDKRTMSQCSFHVLARARSAKLMLARNADLKRTMPWLAEIATRKHALVWVICGPDSLEFNAVALDDNVRARKPTAYSVKPFCLQHSCTEEQRNRFFRRGRRTSAISVGTLVPLAKRLVSKNPLANAEELRVMLNSDPLFSRIGSRLPRTLLLRTLRTARRECGEQPQYGFEILESWIDIVRRSDADEVMFLHVDTDESPADCLRTARDWKSEESQRAQQPPQISAVAVPLRTQSPRRWFKRFFDAPAWCVRAFPHLLPVFAVNSVTVQCAFGGAILSLVGIAGNRRAVPLAFAHCLCASQESWTWFLEHCKSTFPALDKHPNVMISTLQDGADTAVGAVLPAMHLSDCTMHRVRQITEFIGSRAAAFFAKLVKVPSMEEFERVVLESIASFPAPVAVKLGLPVLTYELAHSGRELSMRKKLREHFRRGSVRCTASGRRFRPIVPNMCYIPLFPVPRFGVHMSSPIASQFLSSITSALVGKCGQPMYYAIRNCMLDCFNAIADDCAAFSDKVLLPITERDISDMLSDGCWTGRVIRCQGMQGIVAGTKNPDVHFRVDLEAHTCECALFQEYQCPCPHAATLASHLGLDVCSFVDHRLTVDGSKRLVSAVDKITLIGNAIALEPTALGLHKSWSAKHNLHARKRRKRCKGNIPTAVHSSVAVGPQCPLPLQVLI